MAVPTHYHVLKVAQDAPAAVIRAAHRVLAKLHHPDRRAGDGQATARMQDINQARDVLTCEASRDAYDAALKARRGRRASDWPDADGPRAAGGEGWPKQTRQAAAAAPPVEAGTRANPLVPPARAEARLRHRVAALYAANRWLG